MFTAKKSLILLICFSTSLMSSQPVHVGSLVGGILLNGVGLFFDLAGVLFWVGAYDEFKKSSSLFNKTSGDLTPQFLSLRAEAISARSGGKKLSVMGVVFLGIGILNHTLGTWLILCKKKKKSESANLKDELRKRQLATL